ncbi:MAG TPA: glycosyltransferase family 39 protein, partial [bacterium]|nr:glycosyltransferase family 39 protein [bacterium]
MFAGGLVLRLALLATTAGDPVLGTPMLDAEYAVDWAHAMRDGGPWMSPEGTAYFRTPLYAWFLALAFLLPGPDLLAARILQAVLGAATAAIVADLAGRRLGRGAGIGAGVLAAASWPLLLFGRELLIESIVPFLGVSLLWTLDAAARRPTALRWLAAGAVLGLAAVARANFIVIVPVALLLAVRDAPRMRRALALTAGIALLIAPVTVRNRVVSGDWILLSYQGGLNLWIGNNPEADGMSAHLPGLTSWRNEDVEAMLAREAGRPLAPAEQDAVWRGRALEFFRESPGDALGLLARKTWLFLQGYEIRNNRDLYLLRGRDPVLSLPLPDFGWILPLAAVGMWATRRRRSELADWYGYAGAAALGVIAFFVCARYRLIVWPALLPFAGAGVAAVVDRSAGVAALAGRAALLVGLV